MGKILINILGNFFLRNFKKKKKKNQVSVTKISFKIIFADKNDTN